MNEIHIAPVMSKHIYNEDYGHLQVRRYKSDKGINTADE